LLATAGITTEVYFKENSTLYTSFTPIRYYRSVAFSVPSIGTYQLKSNSVLQKNSISSIDFTITGAGLTVSNGLSDEVYSIANLSDQTMNITARAMKITGLHVEFEANDAEKLLAAFEDGQEASNWSKKSMADCIKAGIVSGKSQAQLAPKDPITRAEVTVI